MFILRLYVLILSLVAAVCSNYDYQDNPQTFDDHECEFPPHLEEDFTHLRRKRLTTETMVCLEDYPYTVSVRVNGGHTCGGSIVSRLWVLTAAECLDNVITEEVSVRTRSVFRDAGGRLLAAVRIAMHPQYKPKRSASQHNLALVKVNMAIEYGPRSQPVILPSKSDAVYLSTEIFVTGFGSVSSSHLRKSVDQELRRMLVRFLNKAECRQLYGNSYRLQYDHMCLESVQGIALCEGDIGDPAVKFHDSERRGTIYGVAVFSKVGECTNQTYAVYTEVLPSRGWIDDMLTDDDSEHIDSADLGNSSE